MTIQEFKQEIAENRIVKVWHEAKFKTGEVLRFDRDKFVLFMLLKSGNRQMCFFYYTDFESLDPIYLGSPQSNC